jgi:hypothetical protein
MKAAQITTHLSAKRFEFPSNQNFFVRLQSQGSYDAVSSRIKRFIYCRASKRCVGKQGS